MLKVITELEKLGLELTDEMKESIKKNIGEEVYSKSELDKKVKKVEEERDQYKGRAETAEETLKGFDGKDLETITKERDEWKEKAETAANEYKQKLEERDYNPAQLMAYINVHVMTSQKIMEELDKVFGENFCRKVFRENYELNPDFVPDEIALAELVDSLVPIMEKAYGERIKRTQNKYNAGKRGKHTKTKDELIQEFKESRHE